MIDITELAKILKDYRARRSLSQGQLAEQLGFTQATVSRIEAAKQIPRPGQLEKLLSLLSNEQINLRPSEAVLNLSQPEKTKELLFLENYSQYRKQEWNVYWANRQLGAAGGDVLLVKELTKNNQLGIIIGDSVGHGKNSAYMSFAFEFSYATIASMLSSHLLSPEFFERSFAQGIVKTGASWKGEPSISIIQVDFNSESISFINRGMPYPVLLSGDRAAFLTDKRAGAFSLDEMVLSEGSVKIKLNPGQSILFYTDGLLDVVQETELTATMQKLNKLFKGDSRAIGKNLMRILQKNGNNKNILDDVSFLILSRPKKGKTSVAA